MLCGASLDLFMNFQTLKTTNINTSRNIPFTICHSSVVCECYIGFPMLGEGKCLVCYTGFHMLGEGKCLVECYTGFRMLGERKCLVECYTGFRMLLSGNVWWSAIQGFIC